MKCVVVFALLQLLVTPLQSSHTEEGVESASPASDMTTEEPNPTGVSTDEPGPDPTDVTPDDSPTETPSDDCEDFYFWNGEKCVVGIGADCEKDEDCEEVDDSVCLEGASGIDVCTCEKDLFGSMDHSECIPKADLVDDEWICTSDENCGFILDAANKDTGTAQCVKEKCQCSEDDWFIYNVANTTYINCDRMLGAECDMDEQCNEGIEGAVCDDTCKCDSGYKEDDDKMKCNKIDSSGASSVTSTSAVLIVCVSGLITKITKQ